MIIVVLIKTKYQFYHLFLSIHLQSWRKQKIFEALKRKEEEEKGQTNSKEDNNVPKAQVFKVLSAAGGSRTVREFKEENRSTKRRIERRESKEDKDIPPRTIKSKYGNELVRLLKHNITNIINLLDNTNKLTSKTQ